MTEQPDPWAGAASHARQRVLLRNTARTGLADILVQHGATMVCRRPSTWGGAWRGGPGRVGGRHDIRHQVTLRRLPLSGRGHQPRRLALLPVSAEPAHGGRAWLLAASRSATTVRQWARKFGQSFANQIRRRLPSPGDKCWGRLIAGHCARLFFSGLSCAGFRVVFAVGTRPLHDGSSRGWDLPRWTTHFAARRCTPSSGIVRPTSRQGRQLGVRE